MAFDSLIFDLDGTLWDSSAACATGWNSALNELGRTEKEITPKDIGAIMGLPHQAVWEKAFPAASEAEREAIARECYRKELETIQAQRVGLYPGVAEGLARLARDYPLFIVSNCMTDYIDTFFSLSGLKPLFKDTACHGGTGKTKAENIALVAARHRLGMPAYIGDTAGDQVAAGRAGVTYFHVTYGFGSPDRECHEFGSFPEIVEYFAKG